MRNIDRIRGMTPIELALFLMDNVSDVENKHCGIIRSIEGTEMYDEKDCVRWLLEENINPTIKIVNDTITKTICYLQTHYPTTESVYIHIAEGCDCIEAPDGSKGFGVYVPESKSIYVAEDIPEKETTIIETISHEYWHFIQHCRKEPFDENEAEKFAEEVVNKIGGVINGKR